MLILCAGFATYSAYKKQVEKYTATAPLELPVVEYSDDQMAELETRLESFQASLDDDSEGTTTADGASEEADLAENSSAVASAEASTVDTSSSQAELTESDAVKSAAVRELVLTADDINALINGEEKLRGKLLVSIDEGMIKGEISIPVESFLPASKGRFLNGSGTFDVSLEDGVLIVRLVTAEVKGEPLPDVFMDAMKKENLAKDIYKDEKNAKTIRRFESIRVEDDKIIARLKDDA
ncbi:hypothetical protein [Rubripirellula tenax]|nr:hypothetical protein [Rubripirellula tenax]